VTEILEVSDLGGPATGPWKVIYRVRRNDGYELTVDCSASERAILLIENPDEETQEFLRDRGAAAAVRHAETAQSPKIRGNTLVWIFPDKLSGGLHVEYEYERNRPNLGLS
jgi:hypothetical protein